MNKTGINIALVSLALALFVSSEILARSGVLVTQEKEQEPITVTEVEEIQQEPQIEELAWLAGRWTSEDDSGSTEELWIAPKGGIMLALHRDVDKSGGSFFEFLRVAEVDGTLVYFASPLGREPVKFRLEKLSASHVVFVNPEHDYPQKIEYLLEGDDTLVARVSAEEDGKTKGGEWRWQRSSMSAPE